MNEKKISILYFGCDFSGWYNCGKIIKIVVTRCHILNLKCTKLDFGWGSALDPAGAAYSAPPNALAGFKGTTSKEKEGRGREEEREGEVKSLREGEGKG